MMFRTISCFDIPHNIVRKSSFRFLIKPISWYDKAHFRARYGAFLPLKWAISAYEMAYIAMRGNTLQT